MENKLIIKIKSFVESNLVGNYKTKFKGSGIEFDSFREYDFASDSKDIDFLSSAKTDKLLVRKYVEERELDVIFGLNISQSMNFGLLNKTKKDIMQELFFLLAYARIISGDNISIFTFDKLVGDLLIRKKGLQNLLFIDKKVFTNDFIPTESDINKFLHKIINLKVKKNLIFLFTDKIEDIDTTSLKIIAKNNYLVFCNIRSIYEKDLALIDTNIGGFDTSSLTSQDKIKYKANYNKQVQDFSSFLDSIGGNFLDFDEETDIYKTMLIFFK